MKEKNMEVKKYKKTKKNMGMIGNYIMQYD